MKLKCGNCEHTFESRVESLGEYDDGPRCSECNSRDVTVVEAGDDAGQGTDELAAEAFSRFRGGETPPDLVESGLATPDQAEELRQQFNDLSGDWVLISGESLEDNRRSAFEQGIKKGRREAGESVDEAFQNGYDTAWSEALQAVRMSISRM